MKVYFLKENVSEYVIFPTPEDLSRYIELEIDQEQNLDELTPILKGDKILLVKKQPTQDHEWDGNDWVISKEKQETLFIKEKETLLNKLADKADEIKTNLLVGYPQTEIESFYRQEKEALAWKADNKVDTPMLKQIARVRGVPFDVLVEKIIEKASQFAVAIGLIIGQRQAFEDRLLATKTLEELTSLEKEIEEWKFQAN